MTDASPNPRKLSGTGTVVVAVVVLLALYVLSLGPMVWLNDNGYLSDESGSVFEMVYLPLDILYNEFAWVESILDAYMDLWR